MNKVTFSNSFFTDIKIGLPASEFKHFLNNRNTVIISDDNLFRLYPNLFEGYQHIILNPGEDTKSLQTIEKIIAEFVKFNLDRNSFVIGFGGGVVSDITGFAASVFMRGLNFGFIASSLLAQVDAAIGGKNGVNFGNFKNYIGTFNMPEWIICDPVLLNTLPENEFKSGLGEVLKYSLLDNDTEFFKFLDNNFEKIFKKDPTALNYTINECIRVKTKIVMSDPLEKGVRKVLNLGHSFGHVIEKIDKLPHGIAVVQGLKIALDISVRIGLLDRNVNDRLVKLISIYGFDEQISLHDEHFRLLAGDKKKNDNNISMVLIKDIGFPVLEAFSVDEIRKILS